MQDVTLQEPASQERVALLAPLQHAIEHAAHLLPAQGPITVFVHHNTLHAFEDAPFEHAVLQGARVFGGHPYLPEDRYREMLTQGRISLEDVAAVLMEDLDDAADELLGFLGTRYHLRLAMLKHPLRMGPSDELRWVVAETDALRRFRSEVSAPIRQRTIEETRHWVMRDLRRGGDADAAPDRRIADALAGLLEKFGERAIEQWSADTWEAFCLQALWRVCHQGVHGVRSFSPPSPAPVRHRDWLLEATGEDSDRLVNDLLIRFCAAFLDQGFAHWRLPHREAGFFRAFVDLYRQPGGPPERWLKDLQRELLRLETEGLGPLESIQDSLDRLGVGDDEREAFLSATLLSLRGFAGILWQIETRGDRAPHPAPRGSLIEFLAVRLILERLALTHVAKTALRFERPLGELRKACRAVRPRHESVHVEQRAFLVFQLAQALGWKPEDLYRLSKQEWTTLVREIEAFSSLERRRIYHLAYERHYRVQALDALAKHGQRRAAALPQFFSGSAAGPTSPAVNGNGKASQRARLPAPKYQVVCCLDDREESFRRHLEEIEPACETFGAAGFYGVAMYYRGAADAHFTPQCPIIIRPQHYVQEEVVYTLEESHRRRALTRRWLAEAIHRMHLGSRTLLGGALTALGGSLASFPLVARVLFPRLTSRLRQTFGRFVQPPPVTQLRLERTAGQPGPAPEQMGYTLEEMAVIVERQLQDIGLTSRFARLILFTGHGSSSLNNPHESAYNCGACAGSRGGPNARAFAQMANDPRVRGLLSRRGLVIPSETVFVGAYHNTCDDSVVYYDLDRLPASHKADFEAMKRVVDEGRERNAHERCRRFESAPLNLSPEDALRHVEGRAEDLAQTRPEYNHATNALCIVGRRSRTRGLFLDRRAFLTSYDPTQDDAEHTILTRILQAAVPVCAGINLEYYFSCVDPAAWGCGTKLPHNITSMLGVMTGAASDLRPGLSNQMVEIHEPVRLTCIIETTPEAMLKILERQEGIARLCRNQWVQLATLSPHSSEIRLFRNGQFELYRPGAATLPEVGASVDWYRGWRDHLGFAVIREGLAATFENRD